MAMRFGVLLLLVAVAGCASHRPAPQIPIKKASVDDILAGVADQPLAPAAPGQRMTTDDVERLDLEICALQAAWGRLTFETRGDDNWEAVARRYETLHWREGAHREDEAAEAMNLMNQAIRRGDDAEARRQWNVGVEVIRACHAHLDLAKASLRNE